MPEIIGVRFKPCGKIYDFEVNGLEVKKGDFVVVESELGLNIGNVVAERHAVDETQKKFKKIVRKATEEDFQQKQTNISLEDEARDNCLERIMARGLPMKLICTEATLDRKRIIFYFTADKRIDFRELVKDLASKFKTRIEMRQIGVRDGARIVGNLGICGREICCKRFLTSFEPISIKMAKKQELVLNTGKLSGSCGRLMCCLGFEYSEAPYEDTSLVGKALPVNDDVDLAEAESVISSVEPFSGSGQEEYEELSLRDEDQPAEQQPVKQEQKGKRRRWHPRRRKKRPAKK
jgi:cell fate regulator YaaT (PSP1 superfamily)